MLRTIAVSEELPITVEQAKLALRIDSAAEDATVERALLGALEYIETHTTLALSPTTYEQTFNGWARCLELERAPVRDLSAVKYLDENGEEQTIDGAEYHWDRTAEGAFVIFAANFSAPKLQPDRLGVVRVTFEAGFDLPGAAEPLGPNYALPKKAEIAALLLAGHWFANREAVIVGTISGELPLGMRETVNQLRIFR